MVVTQPNFVSSSGSNTLATDERLVPFGVDFVVLILCDPFPTKSNTGYYQLELLHCFAPSKRAMPFGK
jgi:hypothetical protein